MKVVVEVMGIDEVIWGSVSIEGIEKQFTKETVKEYYEWKNNFGSL